MSKAISIAHEVLEDLGCKQCLLCGDRHGIELHHWQGRQSTKIIGDISETLLTGLIPLCKKCHDLDPRGDAMLEEIRERLTDEDFVKRYKKLAYASMVQAYRLYARGI